MERAVQGGHDLDMLPGFSKDCPRNRLRRHSILLSKRGLHSSRHGMTSNRAHVVCGKLRAMLGLSTGYLVPSLAYAVALVVGVASLPEMGVSNAGWIVTPVQRMEIPKFSMMQKIREPMGATTTGAWISKSSISLFVTVPRPNPAPSKSVIDYRATLVDLVPEPLLQRQSLECKGPQDRSTLELLVVGIAKTKSQVRAAAFWEIASSHECILSQGMT